MRLFVGFFVPEKIKNYVERVQSELEKLPMSCKMVEPQNIHVCLSFLGEVKETEIDALQKALLQICRNRAKFEVAIGGIKFVPNANFIRVVVLDILDPSGTLKSVCSEIKEKIGGSMKPPHLTLCRVRNISNKERVIAGIQKIESGCDLNFTVNSISLIRSQLSRTGPVYSTVNEFELLG